MKTDDQSPVIACHYKGRRDRFFGKFKDPDETDPKKSWKKIPGGPFPKEFDDRDKALVYARRWYETEMAERKLGENERRLAPLAWPKLCDLFSTDVGSRVRGADASRDELKKRATFLRSSALLSSRPVAEHDDKMAISWVRNILTEPRKGRQAGPRDPLTVRNIGRVLGEIYKFAQRSGHFPQDRRLPTEAEEFKAEISGALKEKAKLGQLTRVPCPIETASAVVNNPQVPPLRRIMTHAYVYTGVRPGEAHGWRLSDYREEHGVLFLEVREQWTLARTGFPSKLAPPKTVWGRRKIPVHASLKEHLDEWLADGWKKHVGRKPQPNDFLFPDASGAAFREERCDEFLADVAASGCETRVKGVLLDIYSLRHTFATAARRAGISSDARDRLLGHRPRDTKAMHYEDEDLPVLAAEIAKLPTLLAPPAEVEIRTKAKPENAGKTALARGANPQPLVPVLVPCTMHGPGASSVSLMISAEEERFELPVGANPRRFSKPLP